MIKKKLSGGALFNHTLKHEYGGGKSMAAGIKQIEDNAEKRGIQKGIAYVFANLSPLERLTGRVHRKK